MPINIAHIYRYPCNWIKSPHDKIGLCVCDTKNLVFWFNSDPAYHGQGQLRCSSSDHSSALSKECFLDLSGVKEMSSWEMQWAADKGEISLQFRLKITSALSLPIKTLSPFYRKIALTNLCVG